MNRVAVTGLGCVSPLGDDVPGFWRAIVEGRSAIGPIRSIPTDRLAVKIAAEISGFDPRRHFDEGRLRILDRFAQLAVVAARQAATHAGLDLGAGLAERTAVVIGTGAGGQGTVDEGYRRVYEDGAARVHPFSIPRLMINAAASQVSADLGITGPVFTVASACASGNHAIGQALRMVQRGEVDVALAGGAEACITLGTMKGWEALRVMATDTCRPFSLGRQGMVLGEGAAVVVLEGLERARARGIPVLAELAGFGMSADAGDTILPSEEGAARAIAAALADAGWTGTSVDYVNAHGTGTVVNDVTETRALHRVFGAHASSLAVSSTKGAHGHGLGASSALELVATIQALREGVVPPTVNFERADPDCDLDYVPNEARTRPLRRALSNAFGFGGLNAVLAVAAS